MVVSMSSSSTERYKSRLFNFLNRKSIHLSNEIGKTIRQLRAAAEFGVQLLLYPVYLMVQAGRSTRQKLEQKAQPNRYLADGELDSEALSAHSTAQPIEQILKAVEPLLVTTGQKRELLANYPEGPFLAEQRSLIELDEQTNFKKRFVATIELLKAKLSWQKNKNREIVIQGIASLIDSRGLVLVNSNNQVLDILSLQQQEQIKNYIVRKFGKAKSSKLQFFQNNTQKFLSYLPDFSEHNPKLLPPVRWVWNVINWVQNSPIAITTNIFGESKLAEITSFSQANISSVENNLPLSKLLESVDTAVANLEVQPLAKIQNFLRNLPRNWLAKINFAEKQNRDRLQTFVRELNKTKANTEPDPFQIQILIRAAIDYFFNIKNRQSSLANKTSHSKNTLLTASKQSNYLLTQSDIVEAPWLSWEDLFGSLAANNDSKSNSVDSNKEGEKTLQNEQLLTSSNQSNLEQLPAAFPLPNKFKKSSRDRLSLNLQQSNSSQPLRVNPTKTQKITTTETKSTAVVDTDNNSVEMITNSSVSDSQSIEAAPECLETDATTLGYVKHPLERLLEWLDGIMLWIENLWLRIWKLINPYLSP
jgi:hypothetical protein